MSYDLGDVVTLGVTTYNDATGAAEDATSAVLTITQPDGTTITPAVTHVVGSGIYTATPTPTLIGLHGVRWLTVGTTTVTGGAYTDAFEVNDPAYLPLIGLADAKDHLNEASSAYDEKIRGLVLTATALAENYCNRPLARRTFVQVASGGNTYILLWNVGVLSITSIVENGVTLQATDYVVNKTSGILLRGTYAYTVPWIIGVDNVTITYVAGFANPPADLTFGVKEILRWLWSNTQENGRPSRASSTDQGVLADALPKWLMRPLDQFVMPGLG